MVQVVNSRSLDCDFFSSSGVVYVFWAIRKHLRSPRLRQTFLPNPDVFLPHIFLSLLSFLLHIAANLRLNGVPSRRGVYTPKNPGKPAPLSQHDSVRVFSISFFINIIYLDFRLHSSDDNSSHAMSAG